MRIAGGFFELSEIDEIEYARRAQATSDDINTFVRVRDEAERTNTVRRILYYYEPEVVVIMLDMVDEILIDANTEADSIFVEMENVILSQVLKRFSVEIIIGNRGSRAIPVMPIGVLKLHLPASDNQETQIVNVPLTGTGEFSGIAVLRGGDAKKIILTSRENIREIIDANSNWLGGTEWDKERNLNTSRFFLLYRAKTAGLRASVVLAKVGLDPESAKLAESDIRPVGLSRDALILEALSNN